MKHQHLPLFGAVVLAFQLSSTASAHHSFAAQYDSSKPIQMRGTVTRVEWTNPHARVYIDVRDDSGQIANWNFEMASPNILVRNGWKQNTVKVGDQPHERSSGFIAVSQMIGNRIELSAGALPIMPGAKVVSVVESKDPGKLSREVLIAQDAGVDSAMKFYEAALANAGWQQIQKTVTTPSGTGPTGPYGSSALFQRDQSQLSITAVQVQGQRGSSILANLVTKDTGLSAQ